MTSTDQAIIPKRNTRIFVAFRMLGIGKIYVGEDRIWAEGGSDGMGICGAGCGWLSDGFAIFLVCRWFDLYLYIYMYAMFG